MDPGAEDRLDHLGHGGAGLAGPADQPLRRPLGVVPVSPGHVLGDRRVPAGQIAPAVAGHPAAADEGLDRPGAQPDLDLLAHELVGHAVVVAQDLDVVVDRDPRPAPLGEVVRHRRQRLHRRALQPLEELPARARQLLEASLVERDEPLA
jgi:hypothetical protein